jgi:hypothetical protein
LLTRKFVAIASCGADGFNEQIFGTDKQVPKGGFPPSRALEINSLSDRFGRKALLIATCVLGFVGAVPLFWLLNQPSALLAQFGSLASC